jgi:hypothetical protein
MQFGHTTCVCAYFKHLNICMMANYVSIIICQLLDKLVRTYIDKSKAKLSFTTVKYYEQRLLKSSVTIDEVQSKLS